MTLQEEYNDYLVEHGIYLQKYNSSLNRKILKRLSEIFSLLREELLIGKTDVTLVGLKAMVTKSSNFLTKQIELLKEELREELDDYIASDLVGKIEVLQELIDKYKIVYNVREPNISKIYTNIDNSVVGEYTLPDMLNLWENKLQNKVKSALLQSYALSTSRYDIIEDVVGKELTPSISKSFNELSSIVATFVNVTDTEVSDSIYGRNDFLLDGEMWNSCLCSTTCASCASLHGAVRYKDGVDETEGNEIPLHNHCQCYWTPVFKDGKDLSFKVDKSTKDNISSDEKPPNFNVWYNSISSKRKESLFGKTKSKMLESGELKLKDLFKNRGTVYTLKELKEQGYRVAKKD